MLKRIGLRFIGVVKTAVKRFNTKHLSEIELDNRGDRRGLILHGDYGKPSLLAFFGWTANVNTLLHLAFP